MTWLSEHALLLLFIAAYLAVLARHAWVGGRRTKSLSDYLVAGRGLGGVVVALSFYATFMSTNTFIGAAGESWTAGLAWCASGLVLFGCCCASWFFVAPRFVPLTKEYQSLTVADFLGYHYRSPFLRQVAAVVVVFASILYLVAIYRGAAITLEELLDVSYRQAALLVFVVVTLYTIIGGFHSVVLTDALQGLLMVVGAVAMFVALLMAGGGPAATVETLRSHDPALVSWPGRTSAAFIFGYGLAVGIKYLVEPRQLSRLYGLKDARAVRIGAVVAPLLVLVTYITLLPIGAMAHTVIPPDAIKTGDTDRIVPYLLDTVRLFGPVFSAFFLLVLLAAAMSSIDSVLLVAASSLDHDLIAPESSDARAIFRTRVWVLFISAASMAAALLEAAGGIVSITAFSGSLYGACFFPPLILGLYQNRRSKAAAIACVVAGGLIVPVWYALKRMDFVDLHEVYVGLAVGTLVYVVISFVTRRE